MGPTLFTIIIGGFIMTNSTREQQAYDAINRYQLEQRKAQLLYMAELATTRAEARRILAEAALIGAVHGV